MSIESHKHIQTKPNQTKPSAKNTVLGCVFEGLWVQYFELASVTWTVSLSAVLLNMMRSFGSEVVLRLFKWCRLISWLLPALILIWPAVSLGGSFKRSPVWCQISMEPIYSPLAFFFGYILVCHFFMFISFVLGKQALLESTRELVTTAKDNQAIERLRRALAQAKMFKVWIFLSYVVLAA